MRGHPSARYAVRGEAVLRDGLRSVGEDGERGASHGEMTLDLAIVLHDGSCRNRGRTATAFGRNIEAGPESPTPKVAECWNGSNRTSLADDKEMPVCHSDR